LQRSAGVGVRTPLTQVAQVRHACIFAASLHVFILVWAPLWLMGRRGAHWGASEPESKRESARETKIETASAHTRVRAREREGESEREKASERR